MSAMPVQATAAGPVLESTNNTRIQSNIESPSVPTVKINPMWRCNEPRSSRTGRSSKLIFVHVFKTAGSTLRTMLSNYGKKCQAGVTIVTRCSGLSPKTRGSNSTWMNEFGKEKAKPCTLKRGQFRNGKTKGYPSRVDNVTSPFLRDQTDILAGHLPIGIHSYWTDKDAQYVAFYRQPVEKLVSGVMFSTRSKKYTFEQVVQRIRDQVHNGLQEGVYKDGYGHYLLSPEQKTQIAEMSPDYTRRMELSVMFINANIYKYNVLVGIVERMHESLQMFQYLIDKDEEQTELFERIGMNPIKQESKQDEGSAAVVVKNKSAYSTGDVVRELQKDPVFFDQLKEYVKYDQMVYDYALSAHIKQYDTIMGGK